MARELMLKHKISHADLIEEKTINIRDIHFRHKWEIELFKIVSTHCRCEMYFSLYEQKKYSAKNKVHILGFIRCIGFDEDITITFEMFKYLRNAAVNGEIEAGKKITCSGAKVTAYYIGFNQGVSIAFDEQDRQHQEQWALTLTIPTDVTNKYNELTEGMRGIKNSVLNTRSQADMKMAEYGKNDGYHLVKNREQKLID